MAVHLYGVTTADAPRPPELKGRRDEPIRLVSDDELAVIVSDVDAVASAGRSDLLAHAHVLEAYVEHATVIPMQFGVVLPHDDVVREQLLEDDREQLLMLLELFDGQVQLTVQGVHHEEPALREVLRRSPALMSERERLRGLPEDLDQEHQLRLGQAVEAALLELQAEDREMILDRLAPMALAVADNDTPGAHEVINAAFLVERDSRETFDVAVGELRRDVEARIRLRYVGPQPPYSFLDAAQAGELAWG